MGLLVVFVVKLINFQRAIFRCPGTEVRVYCSPFLIDGLIIIVILIIVIIKVLIVVIMIDIDWCDTVSKFIHFQIVISQCLRSEYILSSS